MPGTPGLQGDPGVPGQDGQTGQPGVPGQKVGKSFILNFCDLPGFFFKFGFTDLIIKNTIVNSIRSNMKFSFF